MLSFDVQRTVYSLLPAQVVQASLQGCLPNSKKMTYLMCQPDLSVSTVDLHFDYGRFRLVKSSSADGDLRISGIVNSMKSDYTNTYGIPVDRGDLSIELVRGCTIIVVLEW